MALSGPANDIWPTAMSRLYNLSIEQCLPPRPEAVSAGPQRPRSGRSSLRQRPLASVGLRRANAQAESVGSLPVPVSSPSAGPRTASERREFGDGTTTNTDRQRECGGDRGRWRDGCFPEKRNDSGGQSSPTSGVLHRKLCRSLEDPAVE